MKLDILAHRAIGFGLENSVAAVNSALDLGFGVEIDLRFSENGEPYISHDPLQDCTGREFSRYLKLFSDYPDRTIALNVKDQAAALKVHKYFGESGIAKGFAFDFELLGLLPTSIESTAIRISDLPAEQLDAIEWGRIGYVWLDEMEREWVTPDVVREIGARCQCYWVSPELHGLEYLERWKSLEPFEGLTGICTDYALEFLALYGTA